MAKTRRSGVRWVISSGERTYFFAGDTGYFHGFKEIGKRFGPIDVAMLPIGAYEPRWVMRYQHLNPSRGLSSVSRSRREVDAAVPLGNVQTY